MCVCSRVGVGGCSYFQKQEALAHIQGDCGIPEFRMRDLRSTAGTKDRAEKRNKVETCHHPPSPEWSLGCQAIPGSGDVCGTGRTQTVRQARSKFEAHSYQ